MATLAEAVDAAETDWLVSADIPDSVDYLTVESEVVQVTATFPAQYQARDGSTSEPRIRVVRAAGGTTAASHADGTTLTPLIPPSASGGGTPDPGTVVVTEGLEGDVGQALEAANQPTAENFYATMDDVGVQTHIEAVDFEIVRASVTTYTDGRVRMESFDELGVLVYSMLMDGVEFTLQKADLSAGFTIAADGLISLNSDGAEYKIAADGAITIRNADASGTLTITALGEISFSGLQTIIFAPVVLSGLPTADPVVAGALWNDTGTVKVSAG